MMTAIKKDPVFSAPLAWDDPDFGGKDVSLKDYNVLWHECIANEALVRILHGNLIHALSAEDCAFLDIVQDITRNVNEYQLLC
jgi:hypothetical protein